MKRAYTSTPDGQTHYRPAGAGEPVVFIHQAACSSVEFLRVLPLVGAGYHALALDLPGHGNSEELPRKYAIEDYARSVVDFMDSLGIKKASLLGHHGSCFIANEIAATSPGRVDKVILQDCPFYKRPQGSRVMLDMYQCKDQQIMPDGSHLVKEWEYLKQYDPEVSLEILHQFVVGKLVAGKAGVKYYRAAANYDNAEKVNLISQPTLLLAGRNEYFVRNVELLQARIPRSKIAFIEGARLYASHTHPQQYADAVLQFLRNPGV